MGTSYPTVVYEGSSDNCLKALLSAPSTTDHLFQSEALKALSYLTITLYPHQPASPNRTIYTRYYVLHYASASDTFAIAIRLLNGLPEDLRRCQTLRFCFRLIRYLKDVNWCGFLRIWKEEGGEVDKLFLRVRFMLSTLLLTFSFFLPSTHLTIFPSIESPAISTSTCNFRL